MSIGWEERGEVGQRDVLIKTVPCRFVPVTRHYYRKFGLALNCRWNLIQLRKFSLSISILTPLDDIAAGISILRTRPPPFVPRAAVPYPDAWGLTSRIPDVLRGENWWRDMYTRRFAATYTCTRACAHTRLLASSSYESTSVRGRWPSFRSWNQTRQRSQGRGVASTQCVFHPGSALPSHLI